MIAPYEVITPAFVESLTPAELMVLRWDPCVWLRPDQRIPDYDWRTYYMNCGRGYGKTAMAVPWMIRRVELYGSPECSVICVAPNEHRVKQLQFERLLAGSPPWFRLEEYREQLRAPNGCLFRMFTPESPERMRGENAMLAWFEEITDFPARNAMAIWNNTYFATRVGPYHGQIIITSTSKPGNPLIRHLVELNAKDPRRHPIHTGTLFQNPVLGEKYMRDILSNYEPGSRLYREEVMGEIFSEAAGALFTQERLNANRVAKARDHYDRVLVGLDPSYSNRKDADECGIIVAGSYGKHVDVIDDLSARFPAIEDWAALVVSTCVDRGAAGVVVETNHGSGVALSLIKVACEKRGLDIKTVKEDVQFPERVRGVIYVKEILATRSKIDRARGPAALDEAGRLHMVGAFEDLERELVTFELDSNAKSKSPNRYDAMTHVVTELADLRRDSRDGPAPELAPAAQDELRARLRAIGRKRRVL